MTPDRRQFVASLAGVPMLLQSVTAAQRGGSRAGFSDPVLEQIIADLRELKSEVEADLAPRKQTLRALETTLGIQAAHMSAHYDASVRTALRRRESRLGRPGFVQELLNLAHDRKQHDVTYQTLDAALTRLNERGISGSLRDVKQAIRNIRLNAPDGLQPAALRAMQYDYCSDLQWQIQMMEAVVAIACGIAFLEPTVGGEIACGAMTLALGLLYAQRAWFC
ncbi:MAG: hypothetical protein ACRD1W_11325 [Vicinamibacterales bacterium]